MGAFPMSLPYFNLYPSDFEADTSHLTLEEDGAYNRMLRLMWLCPGCSFPDDEAWIARRMRVDMDTFHRVVAPIIFEFMERRNGRIISPRLMREFKKVDETSRKRSDAGKKGGRPQHIEKQTQVEKPGFDFDKGGLFDTRALPEPEPEPEPDKKEKRASAASSKERVIEILCQFVDRPVAESFYGYRSKSRHKALTETGATRLCKQLAAIKAAGGDCEDAVGMAEERGWATVELEWYQKSRGASNGHLSVVHSRSESGPAVDGIMRRLAQRREETSRDRQ